MADRKDKKAAIALAAGALLVGTLGSQALQAESLDLGSGFQIRERILNADEVNTVQTDDVLVRCPGGTCPRPKRPPEPRGSNRRSRRNQRRPMVQMNGGSDKGSDGKCGVGTCGGGDGDEDGDDNGSSDKGSDGKCGVGTCG
jgi:hypothetical protein